MTRKIFIAFKLNNGNILERCRCRKESFSPQKKVFSSPRRLCSVNEQDCSTDSNAEIEAKEGKTFSDFVFWRLPRIWQMVEHDILNDSIAQHDLSASIDWRSQDIPLINNRRLRCERTTSRQWTHSEIPFWTAFLRLLLLKLTISAAS